jgi:hypothetical protein
MAATVGNKGMILWTLSGVGVFLIYAAYKNKSPQALLVHHLQGGNSATPVAPVAAITSGNLTDAGNPVNPGTVGNAGQLANSPAYTTLADYSGQYNLIAPNGSIIAAVPGAYQSSAATYIPPAGVIT